MGRDDDGAAMALRSTLTRYFGQFGGVIADALEDFVDGRMGTPRKVRLPRPEDAAAHAHARAELQRARARTRARRAAGPTTSPRKAAAGGER